MGKGEKGGFGFSSGYRSHTHVYVTPGMYCDTVSSFVADLTTHLVCAVHQFITAGTVDDTDTARMQRPPEIACVDAVRSISCCYWPVFGSF